MSDFYRKKIHSEELIATFDDVLILPGFTDFSPSEVDLSSNLGKYHFNLPIMSSAMDTVTEENMAINMTLHGGLGVLHRNCSFERQLEMVRIVKRARSFVIDDVATIGPNAKVSKAKFMMQNYNISGIVVVNDEKKVCGIFTKRDIPFLEQDIKNGAVKDYMTKKVISIKPGASREEALKILYESRKEKLPIIDEDGLLKGLITKKDLAPEFPLASKDEEGHLLCGLALSPRFPETSHSQELLKEIDKYVDILANIQCTTVKFQILDESLKLNTDSHIPTYKAFSKSLTYHIPVKNMCYTYKVKCLCKNH